VHWSDVEADGRRTAALMVFGLVDRDLELRIKDP
jgi:hypothetical protein